MCVQCVSEQWTVSRQLLELPTLYDHDNNSTNDNYTQYTISGNALHIIYNHKLTSLESYNVVLTLHKLTEFTSV
jgi:hypothetical protein